MELSVIQVGSQFLRSSITAIGTDLLNSGLAGMLAHKW